MINKILKDIDNEESYYVGTNGCLYQDLGKEELLAIKQEIERLTELSKTTMLSNAKKSDEIERLRSIIKEVREYIETKYDYLLGDDTFLDHDERIDRKQITNILKILDKVEEK